MKPPAFLLAALLFFAIGSPAATLAGDSAVLDLFAALPERFVVDGTEIGDQSRIFRLRSAEPVERGAAPHYLKASLRISDLADTGTAKVEIAQRLATADPNLGLSYAWDFGIAKLLGDEAATANRTPGQSSMIGANAVVRVSFASPLGNRPGRDDEAWRAVNDLRG